MIQIAIINPNSTESMTASIAHRAAECRPSDVNICAVRTNTDGPPSIQGPKDAEAATVGTLRIANEYLSLQPSSSQDDDNVAECLGGKKLVKSADAIILACADDVGLVELQALCSSSSSSSCDNEQQKQQQQQQKKKKVVALGIGQAAYLCAASLIPNNKKFSVVTTVEAAVPVLQRNIESYGLTSRCGSVRAAGVLVLDLGAKPEESLEKISKMIDTVVREDGAACVVLGCSGMAPFVGELSKRFPHITVLDGISSAVGLASSLVRTVRCCSSSSSS